MTEQEIYSECKIIDNGATHYNICINKYTKQGGHLLKDWLFWNKDHWQPLSNVYSGFNKPLP